MTWSTNCFAFAKFLSRFLALICHSYTQYFRMSFLCAVVICLQESQMSLVYWVLSCFLAAALATASVFSYPDATSRIAAFILVKYTLLTNFVVSAITEFSHSFVSFPLVSFPTTSYLSPSSHWALSLLSSLPLAIPFFLKLHFSACLLDSSACMYHFALCKTSSRCWLKTCWLKAKLLDNEQ